MMSDQSKHNATLKAEVEAGRRHMPGFAWPTVALTLGLFAIFAASTYLAVTGAIPMVLGVVINSVFMYAIYTPLHEAVHDNISSRRGGLRWLGNVRGALPRPDILVTRSRWDVYLPEGPQYGEPSTNMELVASALRASRQEIDGEFRRTAAAANDPVRRQPLRIGFANEYLPPGASPEIWREDPALGGPVARAGAGSTATTRSSASPSSNS